jgi:hypothetical protein
VIWNPVADNWINKPEAQIGLGAINPPDMVLLRSLLHLRPTSDLKDEQQEAIENWYQTYFPGELKAVGIEYLWLTDAWIYNQGAFQRDVLFKDDRLYQRVASFQTLLNPQTYHLYRVVGDLTAEDMSGVPFESILPPFTADRLGRRSLGEGGWSSGARELIEYVNAHPEVSGDVGQVMFGPATTLTADGPVEYLLYKSSGRRWINVDVELETGCGIVPYAYQEKAAVAALQWVVGLELFLLSADPWRLVLSTDHPNGGSFMAYPELIRLLMDRTYRDDRLKRVNQKLLAGSALADGLNREYTLGEIAIVTRSGPARLLGLRNKGHLGPGADADVTVSARDGDVSKMFATPRYVIKGGMLVVEDGQLRRAPAGRRLHVRPSYDRSVERGVKAFFERYGTVSFEHYGAGRLRDAALPLDGGR